MRPPVCRPALLLAGAASFAILLTAAPTHAQGFGGLNPGAAAGTPFPSLGWRAGSGGRAAPSFPQYGPTSVITPYANPYGGNPYQYGGPYAGQGYGGGYPSYQGNYNYRGTSRSYQVPGRTYQMPSQMPGRSYGGYARIQVVNPGAGGDARPTGILPDRRSDPMPSGTGRTTRGTATLSIVQPPVLQGGPNDTSGNYGGNGNYGGYGGYEPPTFYTGGPAPLGGYYYGGYSDDGGAPGVYPSVYGDYDGFPGYVEAIGPGVTITTLPAPPVYVDDPQPFSPPTYTVTYNQNNYYVTNEGSVDDISQGGPDAQAAVKKAYPADSYQGAFADIERSWDNGDVELLKKHLHSDDTKVSVYLKSAYKYSLNSSDFAQITRDAFDRLDTVSFKFNALQKAKNGDVTAYGTHVYRAQQGPADGVVVAFDPDAAPTDADSADSGTGTGKTIYVSYTLRRGDTGWYVTAINSSTEPLLKTVPQ